MKSKYAKAVREMFHHPDEGPGVFRIVPDTDPDAKNPPAVTAGSPQELVWFQTWKAAPRDLCIWACGRLSSVDPKSATELLDNVGQNEAWSLGELEGRHRYLMLEGGQVVDCTTGFEVEGVKLDSSGNVVDAETSKPVITA